MSLEASFLKLVSVMDELREKCPWDKKQTIETLRPLTIEETYELTDAISDNDWKGIKEELGDIMLHLIFYAKIGAEQQKFTLQDVLEGISEKLIRRHPHIYGDVVVNSDEDVKKNWEQIKMQEGKKSVLSGVPKSLPAVVKATRIQDKARQVGFEWEHKEDVWKKVEEEIGELHEAVAENDQEHIEEEFGDVMFSLINYARFLRIDAEGVLEKTNKKFIARFTLMEEAAASQNKTLDQMSLAEMDDLWNQIKRNRTQ
ncbi:nucleoside triphosphate pyrophosphohydrolase [Segetibacter sp.]|jgi:MazG family protein|uniref:nucleoside triphosphate pyrophosphohydrolase n=1 Tax=Segetibacter sp. TaxID=2231182 RepID=UPI00261D80C2|nr:nucleoside triphosphate pyrophosphohydrolase [Segetibacter sp.]MCW3081942.1 nucleoside triphosphate pyrophosphohydrolase MazG [Segetibacter sp.]